MIEAQNTKLTIIQSELVQKKRTQNKGKRVQLEGQFVYSTQEVLQVVQEAEEESARKKRRKAPPLESIDVCDTQVEEQGSDIGWEDRDSELDKLV